ncbi:MAG: LCP family protein [bacterium]
MPDKSSSEAERRALLAARRRYGVGNLSNQQTRPIKLAFPGKLSPQKPPRRKAAPRLWVRRVLFVIVLIVIISGGIFGYKVIAASDNISAADRSILGQLKDLLFLGDSLLEGESQDRINILLIAIGGEGHKGEDLADTIMVISYQPSNNKAALLSIPRDLYVQLPDQEYFSKINAVHAFGESQKQDRGPELLRDLVQNITSLPMHYYVRVDFTAFKNIIDGIGGINITIDNSFYDYWHKISFPAGTEKMSGERALAYVRARYIEGPEGGDFKRAARQQQVLLSLRDKVFSVQTALDFTKVNAILSSLSNNIRTDMQLWEMKRFYELARLVDQSQVQSVVLSTEPKGILTGGTEVLGGVPASILRPRTGDYSEIQKIARNILTTETVLPTPTAQPPEPSPSVTPVLPSLAIRNGTTITGLAGRTAENLKQQGYDITDVANAAKHGQTQTYVYAISPDHTAGATVLAETLGAKLASDLPEEEAQTEAEVLVILGTDSDDTSE